MSACPVCRSQNPVAAVRCWSCGSPLAQAPRPQPEPEPPQEPADAGERVEAASDRSEPEQFDRSEPEQFVRSEPERFDRSEPEASVEDPDPRETDALDDVTELHEPEEVAAEEPEPQPVASADGRGVKLVAKFSLAIALVFGIALLAGGKVWHDYLQRQASNQVLAQAQLMIQSATAMRTYTEKQIQPLVGVRRTADFHPQWVPFYAATQVFKYLSADYPDYSYKEAALNPMNLRDRAVDWEADIINYFRDHPGKVSLSGERDSVTGRSLYLARPIVAESGCLECHGSPAVAPPRMVALYGPDNGFGWHLNETVGAQIVSVPVAVPRRLANAAFIGWLGSVAFLGLVTLVVVGLALLYLVTRRIGRIADAADEIAAGKLSAQDLPVEGTDEVASLERAFNRMRQSLAGARRR